mgnify:CR=1 FL=1
MVEAGCELGSEYLLATEAGDERGSEFPLRPSLFAETEFVDHSPSLVHRDVVSALDCSSRNSHDEDMTYGVPLGFEWWTKLMLMTLLNAD